MNYSIQQWLWLLIGKLMVKKQTNNKCMLGVGGEFPDLTSSNILKQPYNENCRCERPCSCKNTSHCTVRGLCDMMSVIGIQGLGTTGCFSHRVLFPVVSANIRVTGLLEIFTGLSSNSQKKIRWVFRLPSQKCRK